ncbi:MAG: hemolysin family protein [Clostridia bacterium]|nr:hemolysin family protein [Clostridia bacterium]
MSILPIILVSIGIIICIALSNFFSSSEMSFSAANEVRLEHEADNGKMSAKRALAITKRFDDALSTILIGNNLVNIAASSLMVVLLNLTLKEKADSFNWLGTLVITILVIIFGETIPKITSKKKPNTIAMRHSLPIKVLMTILYPIVFITVKLVNLITGPEKDEEDDEEEAVEEFQSIIETAEDEGVLSSDSSELIQATIDFTDTSASDVMTSRVDMEAIDIDDDEKEIRKFIRETSFTRIPVYEDDIDNIIGVLHINHVLRSLADGDKLNLKNLLMEPCFVYKTMKLPDVLRELKKNKQHLAIVTNEYGGTHGIVTLEDVLEELVGEIWDESDEVEEELIEHDDDFEVDGDMILDDLFEELELPESEFESETVGGWCIEMLEHYPEPEEVFTYENIKVTILETEERRVEKVLIEQEKEEITEEE